MAEGPLRDVLESATGPGEGTAWRRRLGAVLLAALFVLSVWRLAVLPERMPSDVVSRRLQASWSELQRAAALIPRDGDVGYLDETRPVFNRKKQRAVVVKYVLMPRRLLVGETAAPHVLVVLEPAAGPEAVERQLRDFPPERWERLGVYAGEYALLRRSR